MPEFEQGAECRAPVREVWKLLYDPARYMEWWDGTERVEIVDGAATRYTSTYPGTAFPTGVAGGAAGDRVTISCIATDIVYDWTLTPVPAGCAVRVRVALPERFADRLPGQQEGMRTSIARLVRAAEAGGAG